YGNLAPGLYPSRCLLHLPHSCFVADPTTVLGRWFARSFEPLIIRLQCLHCVWKQAGFPSHVVSVLVVVSMVFRSRGLLGSRCFGMLGKRVFGWSSCLTIRRV